MCVDDMFTTILLTMGLCDVVQASFNTWQDKVQAFFAEETAENAFTTCLERLKDNNQEVAKFKVCLNSSFFLHEVQEGKRV